MSSTTAALHPSTVVNDNDHGALATIVAAFCLTLSWVFFAARLLIRWPWRNLFGKDDAAATVATLLALLQSVLVFAAVTTGFGKKPKDLSKSSIVSAEKMLYASDILYTLVLFISKFAVAMLFRRLSSSPIHARAANIIAGGSAVFCLASVLIIALRKNISTPWTEGPATGDSTLYRWIAVEILSAVLDICIIVFPVFLVWDLQMQKGKKGWVILGFACRLPILPVAIIRLVSLSHSLNSNNFIFDYILTEIYTQIEMCISMISATIPCLRIFMQAANTGLLGGTIMEVSRNRTGGLSTGKTTKGSGSSESRNKSQIRSKTDRMVFEPSEAIELQNRGLGQTYTNAIINSDKASMASDSSERAIVVRQTVDVQYS